MQRLTPSAQAAFDDSGAKIQDLNTLEIAACAAGAGALVSAVGVSTIVAPTFVVTPSLIAGGLAIAGYNKRHGHLPFQGAKDKTLNVTPAAETAAAPAAA